MEQRLLFVYQMELRTQCEMALRAADDLDVALRELHTPDADTRLTGIHLWTALQTFLVACANTSKLLWPPISNMTKDPQFTRDWGAALLASLGVVTPNALKNRALRNAFEHFDGRLDEWACRPGHHNLMLRSTLSAGDIVGIIKDDYLATLDPTTLEVTFLGESFPVRPLYKAVKALYPKVVTETDKRLRGPLQ